MDERRRLDHAQPGRAEPVDEAALDVGRDLGGLVLEAVARPHLDDRDRPGQRQSVIRPGVARPRASAASRSTSSWPRCTWSPTATWTRGDAARRRGGDHVLHLHRLQDHQRRVLPDVRPRVDVDRARCVRASGPSAASGVSATVAARASDAAGASARRCRRPDQVTVSTRRPATACRTSAVSGRSSMLQPTTGRRPSASPRSALPSIVTVAGPPRRRHRRPGRPDAPAATQRSGSPIRPERHGTGTSHGSPASAPAG